MSDLFDLAAVLTLDSSQFKSGLTGAQSDASSFASTLSGALQTAAKVAVAALGAVTTGITALGKAAYSAGTEYEDATAKLATIAGSEATFESAGDGAASLSDQLMELSNASGISAADLANTAYNAISAGTAVEDAAEMAETASKLATAGFTDTDSALSVLTTAINSYGESAGTAQQIADSLITVQNLGVTTVADLSSQMGKAIATGSAYGVNLSNLESAYISLTKGGIATAEATTYLSSMMNELGDSSSDIGKIIQDKTGKSFSTLMDEGYSLSDVLGIVYDSVGNDSTAMMNLWGSAEAGKAANAIINQGLETFNDNLVALQDSTGATEEAYATMADTMDFQTSKLKTNIQNIGIELYENFAPAVSDALSVASDAIQNIDVERIGTAISGAVESISGLISGIDWSSLVSGAAEVVGGAIDWITSLIDGIDFTNIKAAIDSVKEFADNIISKFSEADTTSGLSEGINSIAEAIPGIVEWFGKLIDGIDFEGIKETFSSVFDFVSGKVDGFDGEGLLTGITDAINLAIGAVQLLADNLDYIEPIVVELTAAFVAYKAAMAISGIISKLQAATEGQTIAQAALNVVMNANPFGLIAAAIAAVTAALIYLWNNNEEFHDWVVNAWQTVCTFFTETIPEAFNAVVEWFQNLPEAINAFFEDIDDKVLEWGGNLWSNITDWLSGLWTSLSEWWTGLLDGIGEWFSGIWDSISEWWTTLWSNLTEWFSNLGPNLLTLIVEGFIAYEEWKASIITGVIEWLAGIWTNISTWFSNVWTNISTWFSTTWNNISAWFSNLPNNIYTLLVVVGEAVYNWLSGVWTSVSTWFSELFTTISTWFTSLPTNVLTWLGTIWTNVSNWIETVKTNVANFVTSIWTSFTDKIDDIKQAGKDWIMGLWDGINDKVQWIKDKITGFADSVLSTIKSFFGIASPSKVMRDVVGKNLMLGIGVGIDSNADSVIDSMQSALDFSDVTAELPEMDSITSAFDFSNARVELPDINESDFSAKLATTISGDGSYGSTITSGTASSFADVNAVNNTNSQDSDEDTKTIIGLLTQFLPMLKDMKLVLDTGEIVGAIADGVDAELEMSRVRMVNAL